MASTEAGRRLTEAHRLAQARLGAQTVLLLRSTWPLLDLTNLDATVARWLRVTAPLVAGQYRTSASIAAAYFRAYRLAEAGAGGYVPSLAEFTDLQALTTSLTVTGPVALKDALRRGLPLARAADLAESGSAAAGMRHALNGGRNTILNAVRGDRTALGWARVTSGDPCSFCQVLAGRGPVYGQESGAFEAHDSCGCTVEPVFSRDAEWPPRSRAYRETWDEVTEGLGGREALNAYRRAVEA